MRSKEFTTEAALGTTPKRPARPGSRPERGHKTEPRYNTSEAHYNPLDIPNPDDVHKPIKGDEPVKRGDIVWAQDPHNIATVHTGKVKRIGRTMVFLILKNGEELAVPHDEVSKSYDVLSKRAHNILNKKGKHVGNYKVDEMEAELAEHGKASRELCKSSKPDNELGASMLASCKSQGLRARDGNKSHKLGKTAKSRVKVGGHKIKGRKYGGPLPDWS